MHTNFEYKNKQKDVYKDHRYQIKKGKEKSTGTNKYKAFIVICITMLSIAIIKWLTLFNTKLKPIQLDGLKLNTIVTNIFMILFNGLYYKTIEL